MNTIDSSHLLKNIQNLWSISIKISNKHFSWNVLIKPKASTKVTFNGTNSLSVD